MKKTFLFYTFLFLSLISHLSAAEKTINLFLVGPGLVGGEVLKQVRENFSQENNIEIRVIGMMNTHSMIFNSTGINLDNWQQQLTKSQQEASIDYFVRYMLALQLPHSVFVDCTSCQSIVGLYKGILQSNISIVTPNKKANSGSYAEFCALHDIVKQCQVRFLYDSNVGAGLPFIHTIQSMKKSGDSITKIEAILSGTLSYLFNVFDGSIPFSKVVQKAQQLGYTEPDPRDDLNGLDMARKFLILAREAGMPLEMNEIEIQRFLPDDCFDALSVADFYKTLSDYDEYFSNLALKAKQQGEVLRFIGRLENGKVKLSLEAIGVEHPFYHLTGTDNIASIHSRIYCQNPVVIKGPGAGAQVTAASVLSNIVEACIQ